MGGFREFQKNNLDNFVFKLLIFLSGKRKSFDVFKVMGKILKFFKV